MDNRSEIEIAWDAWTTEENRGKFPQTCWGINDGYVCEGCLLFAQEHPDYFNMDPLTGELRVKEA